MPRREHKRRWLAGAAAACLAALACAATVLANAVVYQNHFSRHKDVKELKAFGGKACERDWLRKAKVLQMTVRRGPSACGERPPVIGDSPLPDHDLSASMKIRKGTPKSVRDNAYVALQVRSSKKTDYELRVFPKGGQWRLLRDPAGGGFNYKGTSHAIKGINHRNDLELHAKGGKVKAFANGKRLASVSDPNPEDVSGRRLAVIVASTAHSQKDVIGTIDDLKLAVP